MTREKAAKLLDILKVFDAPDLTEAIRMAKDALREQPQWISVKDKLPEDNQKVLVYTRSGKMCVARWSARRGEFVSSGRLTVTHWRPLPAVPEVQG